MKPPIEIPVQLTAMQDDQTSAEYIGEMDDTQLVNTHRIAYEDCLKAANTQPNSDWHQTCFAAVYLLSCEITKRDIETRVLH